MESRTAPTPKINLLTAELGLNEATDNSQRVQDRDRVGMETVLQQAELLVTKM